MGGSVVEHLPRAQVKIPDPEIKSRIRPPDKEPASPSAYVSAPLCVSLMNKLIKSFKKKKERKKGHVQAQGRREGARSIHHWLSQNLHEFTNSEFLPNPSFRVYIKL